MLFSTRLNDEKSDRMEQVEISNVSAIGNKLEVKLTFSKKMSRYFFKNNFTIYYDKNIENVDESILAIPVVLATIVICWATGADLYVKKLDKTCLLRLLSIRKWFQETFPKFSSSGNIHAEQTIENKFSNNQTALFFSGGIDSLFSYVKHKDQQPVLFTILRTEKSRDESIESLNWYKKFAEQEGLKIHFIRNNLFQNYGIINNNLLTRDYEIPDGWLGSTGYGLIILGLSAPLTFNKIGKVFFSSTSKTDVPEGSNFLYKHDFSWADIDLVHDGSTMTRQEKILYILNTDYHYFKYLRCCSNSDFTTKFKNCGCFCEKCMRTIVGLILAGIDPNECNFKIKNNILNFIKQLFISNFFIFRFASKHDWQMIQKNIPERIKNEKVNTKYHSEQFFKWLESFDLVNYKEKTLGRRFGRFYYHLKYDGIKYTFTRIRRPL